DFKSIGFNEFKAHGGGDFAIRLIEFLISHSISFSIINNHTELFQEFVEVPIPDGSHLIYFDPLYTGGDDNSYKYEMKFIFIHGARMLEMPFDSLSHKYYSFPNNLINFVKYSFL